VATRPASETAGPWCANSADAAMPWGAGRSQGVRQDTGAPGPAKPPPGVDAWERGAVAWETALELPCGRLLIAALSRATRSTGSTGRAPIEDGAAALRWFHRLPARLKRHLPAGAERNGCLVNGAGAGLRHDDATHWKRQARWNDSTVSGRGVRWRRSL